MPESPKTLNLSNMAQGAVDERFVVEMLRVLENINDPNTDWRKSRAVNITVTFSPRNAERDMLDISVSCSSKLVGMSPVETPVFVGRLNGQLVCIEHDPRQAGLFDDPNAQKPAPKLVAGGTFGSAKE